MPSLSTWFGCSGAVGVAAVQYDAKCMPSTFRPQFLQLIYSPSGPSLRPHFPLADSFDAAFGRFLPPPPTQFMCCFQKGFSQKPLRHCFAWNSLSNLNTELARKILWAIHPKLEAVAQNGETGNKKIQLKPSKMARHCCVRPHLPT